MSAGAMQVPAWLDGHAGLLCEHMVQWLLCMDQRLDEVTKGLRMLQRVGSEHPVLQPWCEQATQAIQGHVQAKYGFALAA